MFGDYLIFDSGCDQTAKKIFDKIEKRYFLKKFIISIGGISGTRKSETAFKLAELLIDRGKQCHVISGDDYYKIPWHIRNDERRKENHIVGPDEMDWKRLSWTFETFYNSLYDNIHFFLMSKFSVDIIEGYISKSNCDILIFEGLYGCHPNIESEIKVHIGNTNPSSTFSFRKKRKKENEEHPFRQRIVEEECKAVDNLKQFASFII